MFASEVVEKKCANRYFVRCRDCLSVVAVEGTVPAGAACGLCTGKIEVMGRVTRDGRGMVTGAYDVAACDARCTHARGPRCDCPCGGKNHGGGVTVPVVDVEGAPRVMVPAVERARRTAAEWSAEMDRVRACRAGRISLLMANGTWVGPEDYREAMAYRRIVNGARELRTHKGRMAALSRIQEHGIGRVVVAAPVQASLI